MIWVNGRIIVEGTEQDSIIFTRNPDIVSYHWGTIYLSEESEEISKFKYCKFEYPFKIGLAIGNVLFGAIEVGNGKVTIENCIIQNVYYGIHLRRTVQSVLIKDNIFRTTEEFAFPYGTYYIASYSYDMDSVPLIVGNSFYGTGNNICGKQGIRCSNAYPLYIVNNIFQDCSISINCEISQVPTYIYSNKFYKTEFYPYSSWTGISVDGFDEQDRVYIKKNEMFGGGTGSYADDVYVEISDNYFDGCDLVTENASGKIYNNISNNGEIWTPGGLEVYNNICYNNEGYGLKVGYNPYCINNISINNTYDIWSATVSYENCIIINNEELTQHTINGNPVFRNCIIDFELEYPLIDGGGNIWVDSLSADSIFVDLHNGDFHLIEGSLAIDAGFDTLGYYCPFDMDYNVRIWDGDNDGNAIIDIGPYEYNSPSFGGIEGYTYNPTNGDPVDYVLLKINNQPGEFTFSDSLGNFQYKLPTGVYDVYAERVFFDDVIEYQIEVFDGQFTQVLIPMQGTVDVDDNVIPKSEFLISNLTNFPNPFNPSTKISFSLKNSSNVKLTVYNIKGQRVTTLVDKHFENGAHTVTWNGKDSNNRSVASGIYFFKITAGKSSAMKKMLLIK